MRRPLVHITATRVPVVREVPVCATCGAERDAHSMALVGPFELPLCAGCAMIGIRALQVLAWIKTKVDQATAPKG